jgi:excisionase family DNA binding protein
MRRTKQAGPGDRQPLTLTIPQAAQLLDITVSKAYAAARRDQLPRVRVGSRVLISRQRLEGQRRLTKNSSPAPRRHRRHPHRPT